MANKQQEQRILREAVQAALRLDAYELDLTYDDPFAIRFDDDDETWFGALHFAPDDAPGLVILRGPAGLRWIRDAADRFADAEDLDRFVERIGFVLLPPDEIQSARRGPLVAAGPTFLRAEIAPEFEAKGRNKSARELGTREAKRITMTVYALMDAFDSEHCGAFGAEHPPGVLPTLRVAGDWRMPDVAFELASYVDDLGRADAPVRRSRVSERWPVTEGRWSVAVVQHALVPVDEDEFAESEDSSAPGDRSESGAATGDASEDVVEAAPGDASDRGTDAADDAAESLTYPLLLVADTDAKTLIGSAILGHGTARRAARAMARGDLWTPYGRRTKRFATHLTFTDPALRDAVAEALEADGVTCVVVERDPAIEHVEARLDVLLDEANAALARGDIEFEDDDDDLDDDEFDEEDDGHVHGAGCSHGDDPHDGHFGPPGDNDDADFDEVEAPPDAVTNVLRDARLTGGPGAPPPRRP